MFKVTNIVPLVVVVQVVIISITAKSAVDPVVKISQGELQGRVSESRNGREFYEFLGIPYAKTPPARFEAPEKPEKWNGIRNASKYASPCIYLDDAGYYIDAVVRGQEDCLYINVHTPTIKDAKLPVMVYIKDGFFDKPGLSSLYGYNYFMDENIVLVEFQYRTGAFGFLSTGDEVIQGNMGLKDQVMALHWVQDNIRAFGGDEAEVTIFGVGGGAASVSLHILSPMSEGLFNKAIAQSGSALNPWAISYAPDSTTERLAQALKCKTKFRLDMVECLKSKSVEEIAKINMKKWFRDPLANFAPVVEKIASGHAKKSEIFLPSDPRVMYKEGRFKKVPLMTGVTLHEGLQLHALKVVFRNDVLKQMNQLKEWKVISGVTFYYDEIVPYDDMDELGIEIKNQYFGEHDIGSYTVENLTNAYSDRLFNQGVRMAALLHSNHAPVYPYIFHYPPNQVFEDQESADISSTLGLQGYGVEHGSDIHFMFTLLDSNEKPLLTFEESELKYENSDIESFELNENDADESKYGNVYKKGSAEDAFMKSFIKLWVSFAKTGAPSKLWGSTKKWPAISAKNRKNQTPIEWLKITDEPYLVRDPFQNRTKFWDDLLKPYYKIFEDEIQDKIHHRLHVDTIEAIESRNPIVTTYQGELMGKVLESRNGRFFNAFLGIPYAKPPERFEVAVEFEFWDIPRNATEYGPDCLQLQFHINPSRMNKVVGSENCLYLNVFSPKEHEFDEEMLPVLVVFHDHAFAHGTSRGLGGHYFTDEGIIVVTVNYRLGALGYLSTGDGVANGNLGLKDQVLALEWVNENIEHFGGDNSEVTILGAGSGGAASVTYHILSPMSKRFFTKAIAHSGSALCPWGFIQDPRPAATNLAERLECPTYDSKNMIKCLKAKSGKEIVKQKFFRFYRDPMTTFGPSIEIIPPGASQDVMKRRIFLTEHPQSLWLSGNINRVPLIIGSVKVETMFLYSFGMNMDVATAFQEDFNDNWQTLLPLILYYEKLTSPKQAIKISEKIKEFYLGDRDIDESMGSAASLLNYTSMFSDRLFTQGIRQTAKLHGKHSPVYPYLFFHSRSMDEEQPETMPGLWGEGHTDDLEYFFFRDFKDQHPSHLADTSFKVDRSFEPRSESEKISIGLVKLWSSFIRSGKPSEMYRCEEDAFQSIPLAEWKSIRPQNLGRHPKEQIEWLIITETPYTKAEPFQRRIDFWDSLIHQLEDEGGFDENEKHSKDEL